jgi:hypothetical protein
MAYRSWQTIKICYCDHIGSEVGLEAELVYPAEFLPDDSPRVLSHRCSQGIQCNLSGRPSCVWAGTNPDYDPFSAK